MLGVPDSDADLFRRWIHDIVERPDDTESQVRAIRECVAYFRSQLVLRREQPGDDIISLLARSELDEAPIPGRCKPQSRRARLVSVPRRQPRP
jgi:cytochrome P450